MNLELVKLLEQQYVLAIKKEEEIIEEVMNIEQEAIMTDEPEFNELNKVTNPEASTTKLMRVK